MPIVTVLWGTKVGRTRRFLLICNPSIQSIHLHSNTCRTTRKHKRECFRSQAHGVWLVRIPSDHILSVDDKISSIAYFAKSCASNCLFLPNQNEWFPWLTSLRVTSWWSPCIFVVGVFAIGFMILNSRGICFFQTPWICPNCSPHLSGFESLARLEQWRPVGPGHHSVIVQLPKTCANFMTTMAGWCLSHWKIYDFVSLDD